MRRPNRLSAAGVQKGPQHSGIGVRLSTGHDFGALLLRALLRRRAKSPPRSEHNLWCGRPGRPWSEECPRPDGTRRMELLTHDEFSKLHIREFLPPDEIAEDDTGVEYSPLGFNRCRHLFHGLHRQLAFFYPASPAVTLAGIDLRAVEHFPPESAQRALTAFALPLRFGMWVEEIVARFGPPEYETSKGDYRCCRFRVGARCPCRLGCGFRLSSGLWNVWMIRDDYYFEDDG